MHEFSLRFLRCVRCGGKLELDILEKKHEIKEGFLSCSNCNLDFPIILEVPILWDNFSTYLSTRTKLGGMLILQASSQKMKSFVKKSLAKVRKPKEDRTSIEKRWAKIYQNSQKSKFYSEIKKSLRKIPKSQLALEHGCSIGNISKFLAIRSKIAFGIDRSFNAISIAKKNFAKNLDYFVADSFSHPFGRQKFDLIVALNMLELIEPKQFLKTVSQQTSKFVFLSDPYDFDRGIHSIKTPMDSTLLRKELKKHKFSIINSTKKPSFIPWNLQINSRATLQYKVDLIVGKKL